MSIFNVIIMELINTLIKSNMPIQTDTGLLRINVTLLLRIVTKSLLNILL